MKDKFPLILMMGAIVGMCIVILIREIVRYTIVKMCMDYFTELREFYSPGQEDTDFR